MICDDHNKKRTTPGVGKPASLADCFYWSSGKLTIHKYTPERRTERPHSANSTHTGHWHCTHGIAHDKHSVRWHCHGAGSSPRWTDFCRFCCIAPGTRTSARRSVLRVIYYHIISSRMRRDIAPVHDIATFCTLQEPQITIDDPETTRGHALQSANVLPASSPPACTATALHVPRSYALPTSQPVQRQAHNDRS